MEPLSWTGPFGAVIDPIFLTVLVIFLVLVAIQVVGAYALPAVNDRILADGTIIRDRGPNALIGMAVRYALLAVLALIVVYIVAGMFTPLGTVGIVGALSAQLSPVWITLLATFLISIVYKRKLGLYGKLFDSTVGMIGFGIVMFWVYTAIFAGVFDMITTHDELAQVSGMKNKAPGTPVRGATEGVYPYYLLGGDNLARDVFSRVVEGSWIVITIAPPATLFSFMVGITLGLPAGYFGGKSRHLLVVPVEPRSWPSRLSCCSTFWLHRKSSRLASAEHIMALILFLFPLIFLWPSCSTRGTTHSPRLRNWFLGISCGSGGSGSISRLDLGQNARGSALGRFLSKRAFDLFDQYPRRYP